MNQAKAFAKHLSQSTEKLDSRLQAFIAKPESGNIHDIRTAIRRVRAAFDLLPKGLQKKPKVSAYVSRAKSFFSRTSDLRDIDVVETFLKRFEMVPGVPNLLAELEGKRSELMKIAMRSAKTLSGTPPPKFKASQISESKLEKRKKKVETKYEDRMTSLMAAMLSEPKMEQLHEFRKSSKMLRYALEIDAKKKDKRLALFEEFQTILGSIVDAYTIERFLSESSLGEASATMMSELKASRDKAYQRFVKLLEKHSAEIKEIT